MKKVFLAIAVVVAFAACNNTGEGETPKTDSPAVKVDSPVVETPKVDSPAVKADSPAVAAPKADTIKK